MSFFDNINGINPSSYNADISGALRTSQKNILGYYKKLNYANSLIMESVGTGTDTYANGINTMAVTAGQYRIRQSKLFHPYYPGQSQLADITYRNFANQSGVIKRAGYFSSSTAAPYDTGFDGFFLESNGTDNTYNLKIYNAGTLIESVPSTQWENKEAVAGYNWNNFTVTSFDFLWLGGVGLRFFLAINGAMVNIHTHKHAGNYGSLIMRSPNQPIRYEIVSTTGSGSFDEVCSVVSTEGVSNINDGYAYSVKTGLPGVSLTTANQTYALMGIRKRAGFRENYAQFVKYFANNLTASNLETAILVNPTIAGTPTWVSAGANTCVEYFVGNGTNITVTGGTPIDDSVTYQRTESLKTYNEWLAQLNQSIGGVFDIIVLSARASANASVVSGAMKILEI